MRNRIIRLLFLPIALLFWIMGWTMFWAGSHKQRQANKPQPKRLPKTFIRITGMIPEELEQYETQSILSAAVQLTHLKSG